MKLVFVHGWSVTNTDTYGKLPEALAGLAAQHDLNLDISHIHLGRYVSFDDEITLDDVARAFEQARLDTLGNDEFSCITHSTGGPVIRQWVFDYFFAKRKRNIPLRHAIMLAPANHGSSLAALGKMRITRIAKELFQGEEQGVQILRWLALGSSDQLRLNTQWMQIDPVAANVFPVVITGQHIDNKFYDFINNYLVEPGSDGVVRCTGANLNYRRLRLTQERPDANTMLSGHGGVQATPLVLETGSVESSPAAPFAVVPNASHSGGRIGIMRSVKPANATKKPVVGCILRALSVGTNQQYRQLAKDFAQTTKSTQAKDKKCPNQFSMIIFRVTDDRGNTISDYDMLLLAGDDYRPDILPKGFFQDRQRNHESPNTLVYYVNHSKMRTIRDGKVGFRITARPKAGLTRYIPAEFRSNGISLKDILRPNETLIVDVVLKRMVDEEVFRLEAVETKPHDFSDVTPSGRDVT